MKIVEMRSALEADHNKSLGALPTMPGWAVRYIFEKRNGLPLTSLPREVEARTLRNIAATRSNPVTASALATQSEREEMQRRIRAATIAFLQ